jgi:hypothetical protein
MCQLCGGGVLGYALWCCGSKDPRSRIQDIREFPFPDSAEIFLQPNMCTIQVSLFGLTNLPYGQPIAKRYFCQTCRLVRREHAMQHDLTVFIRILPSSATVQPTQRVR